MQASCFNTASLDLATNKMPGRHFCSEALIQIELIAQCALCNAQCALCNAQCAICTHCAMCIYCTMSIYCAMCIVQGTVQGGVMKANTQSLDQQSNTTGIIIKLKGFCCKTRAALSLAQLLLQRLRKTDGVCKPCYTLQQHQQRMHSS